MHNYFGHAKADWRVSLRLADGKACNDGKWCTRCEGAFRWRNGRGGVFHRAGNVVRSLRMGLRRSEINRHHQGVVGLLNNWINLYREKKRNAMKMFQPTSSVTFNSNPTTSKNTFPKRNIHTNKPFAYILLAHAPNNPGLIALFQFLLTPKKRNKASMIRLVPTQKTPPPLAIPSRSRWVCHRITIQKKT